MNVLLNLLQENINQIKIPQKKLEVYYFSSLHFNHKTFLCIILLIQYDTSFIIIIQYHQIIINITHGQIHTNHSWTQYPNHHKNFKDIIQHRKILSSHNFKHLNGLIKFLSFYIHIHFIESKSSYIFITTQYNSSIYGT